MSLRHADGFDGWPSQAPFQGILVAAAPAVVPSTLLAQLDDDGGRLLIPAGPAGRQALLRITRTGDDFERETLGAVSFVPLVPGQT